MKAWTIPKTAGIAIAAKSLMGSKPAASHVRFCFPDTATADAFQERFGGTRLTYSPSKPGRPSGPRVRYQRSYSPRIVRGKVMTPADLRRLHKYMLDIKKVTVISDEMRAVVEREWPELVHKLPPRG
jgi:hypothetical protein